MKLNERSKFSFRFAIFLILFGILIIVVYSPIHEALHLLAYKITGHQGYPDFSNLISPTANCLDCANINQHQLFLHAIAPHIFSFFIINISFVIT